MYGRSGKACRKPASIMAQAIGSISDSMERIWWCFCCAGTSGRKTTISPSPRHCGRNTGAGRLDRPRRQERETGTNSEAEGGLRMPLTRSFRETVAKRARSDAAFRAALVEEAVQNILDGDVETALGQLRDVVNATMGFDALAVATGVPKTSLMRM